MAISHIRATSLHYELVEAERSAKHRKEALQHQLRGIAPTHDQTSLLGYLTGAEDAYRDAATKVNNLLRQAAREGGLAR